MTHIALGLLWGACFAYLFATARRSASPYFTRTTVLVLWFATVLPALWLRLDLGLTPVIATVVALSGEPFIEALLRWVNMHQTTQEPYGPVGHRSFMEGNRDG